jgi:hypothetical protein
VKEVGSRHIKSTGEADNGHEPGIATPAFEPIHLGGVQPGTARLRGCGRGSLIGLIDALADSFAVLAVHSTSPR